MRIKIIRLMAVLVLAVCTPQLQAQAQAQTQEREALKVLFIGNSYTYFWNLPQIITAMGERNGKAIMARKSTVGGTNLRQHWDGELGLNSRAMIENGDWDIVVLQNHSLSTIDDFDEFMDYGGRFIDLVRQSGATPMLYMTWAREFNPLMQDKISAAYRLLGEQKGVEVVPVGEVWRMARELRPDLDLFIGDGSHPTNYGTYLIACVFYSVLTDLPAQGLPARLSTTDKNGEELIFTFIDPQDATFMQDVVDSYLLLNEAVMH